MVMWSNQDQDSDSDALDPYAQSDDDEPFTQGSVADDRAGKSRQHEHVDANADKLRMIDTLSSRKVLLRGKKRFAPHWVGIRFLEKVLAVSDTDPDPDPGPESSSTGIHGSAHLVIDTEANTKDDRLLRFTASQVETGLANGSLRYLSNPDTLPAHVRLSEDPTRSAWHTL